MSWKSKNQKKSDDPNLNSRPHFFDWFKHGSVDNPKPTGAKSSLESIKAAVRRKTRTEPHRKRIDLLHGGKKKESGDDGKKYKEGAVVDARKKPQRLLPGRREEEELESFNGLESSGPALSREDSDLTLQRFAADWLGPDAPPSGHARKPSYCYESDEEELEEDDYAEEGEDFEGSSSLSRENSGISLQRFAADWLGPVEEPSLDKRKPQPPSRISGGKNGGSFGNGQGFGSEGPWGGGSNSSSYLSREGSDDVALQRFAAAWLGPPDGRKAGFFGEDSDEEEDEEGLDHFMGHESPHQPHLSRESSDVALQRLAAEWIGPFSVSSPLSRPLDSSSGSAFSAEYSVLPPLPLRPLPRLVSRLRAPPKRLVQVPLETDTSVNNQRPSHLRASSSPELSLVAPSIFTPDAPFTSQTNAPSELPLSLPQPPLTRPVSLPRPPRRLLPQSSLQAQVPTPSLVLPQPPAPLPSNESLSPQPPACPSSNEVLPPQPSAPPSSNEVLLPKPSPSPSPSAPPPPPPPPQLPKPAPSAPPPPPPPAPKPPKPPQPPAPPPPMAKKAPPPLGNAKPGLPSKDGANVSKLKPLHWEKVQADPSHSTVWEKVRAGSFHLNEDVVESLFGLESSAPAKDSGKPRPALPQKKGILDPKKSQNITIQLRALHLTKEEIRSALLEGDALKAETLEILVKMCPSKEEQKGLLTYTGDISELSPSERFLKAVLEIPFAFDRMKAMLFKSCFEDDLLQVQESLRSLEMACKEVRNSRLFLKLLEAVLKTGNRMNKGTARGDAEAFRLDSLLKLSDVKSADGKISLLHFVVAEIAKAEGMRESSEVETPPPEMSDDDYKRVGLRVMLQLGVELSNVKKVAGIDHSELVQSVKKLASGQASIKQLIQTKFNEKAASPEINSSGDGDDSDIFPEQMTAFIEKSEKDVIAIDAELDRVLDVVKEATTYFQGKSKEKDPLRMFVIVRDFLGMLEKVCMDLGKAMKRLRG